MFEQKIDWFSFQNSEDLTLNSDQEGIITSQVVPGLRLDISATLNGNLQQVLTALQAGINSQAHQMFIEQMANDY